MGFGVLAVVAGRSHRISWDTALEVLPVPIPSPAPKGPHLHLKPEVTKSVPHCKDTPELCSPSAESSSPHIFPRLSSQAEQLILGQLKIPAHR